jgi:hypothetical protein
VTWTDRRRQGASPPSPTRAGDDRHAIARGIPVRRTCQVAGIWGLTDDGAVQRSSEEVVSSIFE